MKVGHPEAARYAKPNDVGETLKQATQILEKAKSARFTGVVNENLHDVDLADEQELAWLIDQKLPEFRELVANDTVKRYEVVSIIRASVLNRLAYESAKFRLKATNEDRSVVRIYKVDEVDPNNPLTLATRKKLIGLVTYNLRSERVNVAYRGDNPYVPSDIITLAQMGLVKSKGRPDNLFFRALESIGIRD